MRPAPHQTHMYYGILSHGGELLLATDLQSSHQASNSSQVVVYLKNKTVPRNSSSLQHIYDKTRSLSDDALLDVPQLLPGRPPHTAPRICSSLHHRSQILVTGSTAAPLTLTAATTPFPLSWIAYTNLIFTSIRKSRQPSSRRSL